MFVLSRLEEDFRVLPKDLAQPRVVAVSVAINEAILDRIVHDLGLCVTLYDILSMDDGVVYPNDGGVWFRVTFRMVIFRPFVGEVLIAKVKRESK